MAPLRSATCAGLVLLALAGCGRDDENGQAAAVDNHLNQIIAQEEQDRQNLIAEARAREALREREMEAKAANYAGE